MRSIGFVAAVVALAITSSAAGQVATEVAAPASTMGWPEAAEMLQRERLAAEVCARAMKRHLPEGDPAALSAAEAEYEAGRIEFNAVIAGLQVALIDKTNERPTLETVEERTAAGTEARRAFCDKAEAMVPPAEHGEKGVIAEVLSGTVGEVVKAAVAIWERLRDDNALRRASLRTALEDAKWPAFTAIQP